MPDFEIRDMRQSEAYTLWRLFHDTVRHVNLSDYSQEQVAAWSPEDRDLAAWSERMAEIAPFVATCDGEIVGYSDLQPDGLVDHLFVHRNWQGRGVARVLLREVERRAQALKLTELHAYVSITARPVFEKFGFAVEHENEVDMGGVVLKNFFMKRAL